MVGCGTLLCPGPSAQWKCHRAGRQAYPHHHAHTQPRGQLTPSQLLRWGWGKSETTNMFLGGTPEIMLLKECTRLPFGQVSVATVT